MLALEADASANGLANRFLVRALHCLRQGVIVAGIAALVIAAAAAAGVSGCGGIVSILLVVAVVAGAGSCCFVCYSPRLRLHTKDQYQIDALSTNNRMYVHT